MPKTKPQGKKPTNASSFDPRNMTRQELRDYSKRKAGKITLESEKQDPGKTDETTDENAGSTS